VEQRRGGAAENAQLAARVPVAAVQARADSVAAHVHLPEEHLPAERQRVVVGGGRLLAESRGGVRVAAPLAAAVAQHVVLQPSVVMALVDSSAGAERVRARETGDAVPDVRSIRPAEWVPAALQLPALHVSCHEPSVESFAVPRDAVASDDTLGDDPVGNDPVIGGLLLLDVHVRLCAPTPFFGGP